MTTTNKCQRYAQYMPNICPIYAQEMPKICPRYAQCVPMICPWYAQDMLQIRPRYAQDMPKICPRYVKDMQKIFPKYAKDIPKISGNGWPNLKTITDSLSDSTTWIQETLAHLKIPPLRPFSTLLDWEAFGGDSRRQSGRSGTFIADNELPL